MPLLRAGSPKADVAHNHDHATNAPCIPRGHEEGCPHSPGRRRCVLARLLSIAPDSLRTSHTEGVGKSTIITSLIKESYVAHVRRSAGPYDARIHPSLSLGPACRTRSHHTARGHPGEHYNIHRGLGLYVPTPSAHAVPFSDVATLQAPRRTARTSSPRSARRMSSASSTP